MRLKAIMVTAAVALSAVLGVTVAENSWAVNCPAGSLRDGAEVSSYAECNLPETTDADKPLMETVIDIINVIVGVVGVVAVIAIVIGAVFFVVSTGDAAKTTRARNTILYGLVGLVVSLLAFAIVNFVLSAVFNKSSTGGSSDSSSSSSQTTKKDEN